ncbi:MAG: hypothetical protein H6740_16925 [Alphaproteobacteria bacterium]|nr:hypothetical protein [Alphaproteobacteria bacterium]
MPELIACPSCGAHVFASACACPHCHTTLRQCSGKLARTAAAAAMGLMLAGCGSKPEPDYGIPDTGVDTGDSGAEVAAASED